MAEQLGDAVLTIRADTTQLDAGLQRTRDEFQKTQDAGEKVFGGLRNAFASFASIAGIVGIGVLTQQIIQVGKESEQSKIQLNALAGAYGEAAQAADATGRISKVLSISTLEARDNFAQLYGALRGAGIGLRELEVLFVGISKAAQLSGASTAEAASGLLQLKQSLSSGRAAGEELQAVLETMPVFAQALAKELKAGVGDLKQLGSEGKITSEVIFNAAKSLATANIPAKASAEALSVAFADLKETAAAAFGPTIVTAIKLVTAGIQAFSKFVEENKQGLNLFAQSIVGIIQTFAPLVAGILAVRLAMDAWTLAINLARIAQAGLLALSGPAGWAALAGGALAAAAAAAAIAKGMKASSDAIAKAKAEASKALEEFKKLAAASQFSPQNPPSTGNPATQEKASNQAEQNAIRERGLNAEITYRERILGLQISSLTTQKAISDTEKLSLEINENIRLAIEKVTEAKAKLNAEISKSKDQSNPFTIEQIKGELTTAIKGVRKAYIEAGVSLVQNAIKARDVLISASQRMQDTLRGGFQYLTKDLQQAQIQRARATIQPLVDQGIIRTGIDISTPEKLFAVANFADQYNNSVDNLRKAQEENTKAVNALTNKDWTVYLSTAQQLTPIPLPVA